MKPGNQPPCHDGALFLYLFLLAILVMAFYLTVALLKLTVDPVVSTIVSASIGALAMAARSGNGGSGGTTSGPTPSAT